MLRYSLPALSRTTFSSGKLKRSLAHICRKSTVGDRISDSRRSRVSDPGPGALLHPQVDNGSGAARLHQDADRLAHALAVEKLRRALTRREIGLAQVLEDA